MLLFLDGFVSTSSAGFLSSSCLCKLKHFQDCHNSTWLYRWASLHAWNRVSFYYCCYPHHHHHHHASSGRFLSGGTKYIEKWIVVHLIGFLLFFSFFYVCVDNLMIVTWMRDFNWTFDVSIAKIKKTSQLSFFLWEATLTERGGGGGCWGWASKLLAFVYYLLMWL